MNVTAEETKNTEVHPEKPRFLIGVRINNQVKSELYDPKDLKLRVGMSVMVNTNQGLKMGLVASNKIINFSKNKDQNIYKVVRIANENDFQAENRRQKTEHKAKNLCSQKISELELPMNLSRVVHQPHMNKTIFFFTAEGRVDFRQLIRDLASNLRHRIEMKQVGVRDEAKVVGGFGICGETLCCSSWLPDFTPVTIKMAKTQGLALNPSKISGVCGRLMCCLQYEHENYKELAKGLPRANSHIQTPDGPGKVLKNEILEQKIIVRLDDESIMTYHKGELKNNPSQTQTPDS
ncbi:MAG: sporulation protein [Nitrospinae bacterium]|nr:sporulation protein [Nitrospinota bacterium]MZH04416.1 sporulation protein [Nitrospinota bacterium]MZH14788.1 sporulation protein [Nitrospinota bacterium]